MLTKKATQKETSNDFTRLHDSANSGSTSVYVTPDFDFYDPSFVDQTEFEITNDNAPLVQHGDVVYCTDDFTGKKFEAIYLGWYEDFKAPDPDGFQETSPYFSESNRTMLKEEMVSRIVVHRLDNGSVDHMLPENCLSEAQVSIYYSITVKVSNDS